MAYLQKKNMQPPAFPYTYIHIYFSATMNVHTHAAVFKHFCNSYKKCTSSFSMFIICIFPNVLCSGTKVRGKINKTNKTLDPRMWIK